LLFSWMPAHTVLVLAEPAERQLAMLERLPAETNIATGNNLEALERAAGEADVVLMWSGTRDLLREVLRVAPRVRWVHSRSAGLDSVLFPELTESPALLTNGRGVFSQSLGEFAIGAVLFFAKDFRRMIRSQEQGRWDPFDVTEIRGQSMGIVGYGDIGRAVASRAKAMGMRVVAVRRRPELSANDPYVDEVLALPALPDLMKQSDYVTVAAPLAEGTRGLIGEAELGAMKRDAVIINIGRGPVILEAALVRALEERRIRGAALDVFDEEPLPEGHPFYRLDNILLSPHSADHTATWLEDAMRFFLDNFERFRKGEPLMNIVDKRLGY
jgi:phosphoglycerate dehydrogenase-like enzyme